MEPEVKPKLYFANDCSAYHGGSWAVADVIRRQAKAAGWRVVTERSKTKISERSVLGCDMLLVNGEGTLHHDRPRARHLISLLRMAQENGIRTALVNTSWADMAEDCAPVLRNLDILSVREPASALRVEAMTGRRPDIMPDLSLQHPLSVARTAHRKGILVTDFYIPDFGIFMAANGGDLARQRQLDMRRMGWRRTLYHVARCEVLVTGRFHGLCAALATRTPFVAWSGNTDKVEAFLGYLGAEELIPQSADALLDMARNWKVRQVLYEAVFDRVAGIDPWVLPPALHKQAN